MELRRILAGVSIAMFGFGQASQNLSFEAASVRPGVRPSAQGGAVAGIRGGPGTADPERFTGTYVLMKELLMRAYGVKNLQIAGPSWMDTERYDIAAKVPPGATVEQVNLMLQNLLVERFGLMLHRESKEMPVYELALGKGAPKLKDSDPQTRPSIGLAPGPDRQLMISAKQQTLAAIFPMLEARWGHPFVDKTGLTGKYDFSVQAGPSQPTSTGANPADSASDPANSIAAIVERDLGLRLDEKKAPVDLLVIDRVNKVPNDN